MQDNTSVKAKMINLINSVRTLMRSRRTGEQDADERGMLMPRCSTAYLPECSHNRLGSGFWLKDRMSANVEPLTLYDTMCYDTEER